MGNKLLTYEEVTGKIGKTPEGVKQYMQYLKDNTITTFSELEKENVKGLKKEIVK